VIAYLQMLGTLVDTTTAKPGVAPNDP